LQDVSLQKEKLAVSEKQVNTEIEPVNAQLLPPRKSILTTGRGQVGLLNPGLSSIKRAHTMLNKNKTVRFQQQPGTPAHQLTCKYVMHTVSGVHCKEKRYKEKMTKSEVKKLCKLEQNLI